MNVIELADVELYEDLGAFPQYGKPCYCPQRGKPVSVPVQKHDVELRRKLAANRPHRGKPQPRRGYSRIPMWGTPVRKLLPPSAEITPVAVPPSIMPLVSEKAEALSDYLHDADGAGASVNIGGVGASISAPGTLALVGLAAVAGYFLFIKK